MFDLEIWQWVLFGISALLVGISKTGIPGAGILVVPLMASVIPAKTSVGVVLPMLIFADLFAAGYYRYHAQWKHIFILLPLTLIGIAIGSKLIGMVDDRQLKPIIGIIVLVMLGLKYLRDIKTKSTGQKDQKVHKVTAGIMGLFAGITTMMANAAGPVINIYLLLTRLDKKKFIGTGAWFFFIINWLKVPFFVHNKMITIDSLKLDLCVSPIIAIGAFAGIFILKKMPQKLFNIIVQILTAAAAIKLLIPG